MDKNLISFDNPELHSGRSFHFDAPIGTPNNTDTLKVTAGVSDIVITGVHILGGREDCADVNNKSHNVSISFAEWAPQGRFLATIKGGAHDVTLTGDVSSHGTEVDIDLGNSSEQSDKLTGRVRLNLVSRTGNAITVRCLWAKVPELPKGMGPFKYAFPWPWLGPVRLAIAWVVLRFLALQRTIKKKL